MGKKFNMANIKGLSAGEGLLNEASKLMKAKEMKIIYLQADQIDKSEKNKGISIAKIEELADSIFDVGILHPPIVKQKLDGRYEIVAGERRYSAVCMLIEDGRWEKDHMIRCSLFDPDNIDLKLTDDQKEDYVRNTENAEQREKSDGDRLLIIRNLRKIYETLRENGEITNVKTRTLIARDMSMSEATVALFQKVENKGSEEVIGAVLDDRMSIVTAASVVDLPEEQQKAVVEKALDEKEDDSKVTKADIAATKRKMAVEQETKDLKNGFYENHVTAKSFRKDISDITKVLKMDEAGVALDSNDYMKYLKAIETLKELIKK